MKNKVIKLTDKNLKAEASGDVYTLREENSPLRFRFHAGRDEHGHRQSGTWYIVRCDKWHWLGHWPALTAPAAKKVVPEKLAQLAISANQSVAVSNFETVGDVLSWYLPRVAKDTNLSAPRKATIKSAINRHLIPALGSLAIDSLHSALLDDVLIWPLQETHSLSTVKSVMAILKQAFKRAQKQKRIESNPLKAVFFSDFFSVSIKEKDGRLFASDMQILFERLLECDRVTQCLTVMLIGHGTRITETRFAKWSHIDLMDAYWRIPRSDTKTSEWHKLPLSPQMVEFLTQYRAWQTKKGYRGVFLFPGHGHAKPISYSTSRTLLKQVSEGNWSAHDCRKAMKTIMTDALSINDAVSERILNHAMDSIRKAYDQALYDVPMLEALTKYHSWLDRRGFQALRDETETRSPRSFKHAELSHCMA
ncbi:tyrosine-type recombinase/integrase [Vibrio alginolyticus]